MEGRVPKVPMERKELWTDRPSDMYTKGASVELIPGHIEEAKGNLE